MPFYYLQEKQALEKRVSNMEEELKVSPGKLYSVCMLYLRDVFSPVL